MLLNPTLTYNFIFFNSSASYNFSYNLKRFKVFISYNSIMINMGGKETYVIGYKGVIVRITTIKGK